MYGAADAAPDSLLYVGKAASLRDRVGSYFQQSRQAPKVEAMVRLIRHVEVTVTASETEALLLEANLIKEHRPRFNVVLRDDKSFPYILLHEHAFPRLAVYRGPRTGEGPLLRTVSGCRGGAQFAAPAAEAVPAAQLPG